jgi:hypothetical protein
MREPNSSFKSHTAVVPAAKIGLRRNEFEHDVARRHEPFAQPLSHHRRRRRLNACRQRGHNCNHSAAHTIAL